MNLADKESGQALYFWNIDSSFKTDYYFIIFYLFFYFFIIEQNNKTLYCGFCVD